MDNNTQLTLVDQNKSVYQTEGNFLFAQRAAQALAASKLVPPIYQGTEGVANCMIALELANRLGTSPFIVMQNMTPIQGRPSWSSTYIIATVNASGRFKGLLKFKFTGEKGSDERECVAYAVDKNDGLILEGPEVNIKMAKEEGWYARNGSKWKTMPENMLRYRAAAFFGRLYISDLMMGMHTTDEEEDINRVNAKGVDAVTEAEGQALSDMQDNMPDPNETHEDAVFEEVHDARPNEEKPQGAEMPAMVSEEEAKAAYAVYYALYIHLYNDDKAEMIFSNFVIALNTPGLDRKANKVSVKLPNYSLGDLNYEEPATEETDNPLI